MMSRERGGDIYVYTSVLLLWPMGTRDSFTFDWPIFKMIRKYYLLCVIFPSLPLNISQGSQLYSLVLVIVAFHHTSLTS